MQYANMKTIIKLGDMMMKRPSKYNTKQSEAIISYLIPLKGKHTTAAQIASYFKREGFPIGLATIYRHLDTLVQNGKVNKYTLDGVSGACYQYLSEGNKLNQTHLKCERCGAILHIQCDAVDSLPEHLYEKYAFRINPMKTVFYGKCSNCMDYDK